MYSTRIVASEQDQECGLRQNMME